MHSLYLQLFLDRCLRHKQENEIVFHITCKPLMSLKANAI